MKSNAPEPAGSKLFDRPLPPGYRDELRASLAERPAAPQTPANSRAGSVLLLTLGGVALALPTRVASAVAPTLHIARIPHRSGTVLLGLAAFRGDILPCCSLARLLGLETRPGGTSRTLILEESPGRRWAAPIDGVIGFRVLGAESERQAPSENAPLGSPWVVDTFSDHGTLFYRLDHEVLFRQMNLATA